MLNSNIVLTAVSQQLSVAHGVEQIGAHGRRKIGGLFGCGPAVNTTMNTVSCTAVAGSDEACSEVIQ